MSPIIALGQMLLSWCRPDFWIWNDVVIAETSWVITVLPVLVRHFNIRYKTVSPTVARGYMHAV